MKDDLYHYIVVRKDLPIEHQLVQIVHAVGESILEAPVPPTTRAVLLHADSEGELRELSETLTTKGLAHVLICEPDPPYNGAAVAIGVAPSNKRNQLRKAFFHQKLVQFD